MANTVNIMKNTHLFAGELCTFSVILPANAK